MYTERPKGQEVGPAKEKSQDTPEAKVYHVRRGRPKGSRRDSKTRKPTRGHEGRDCKSRRSAKIMGITWLGTECDKSPSGAHYLVGVHSADGGEVYCCKYCWRVKWLPASTSGAEEFDKLIYKYGTEIAYQKLLDRRYNAKEVMYQLQDIWMLAGQLGSKDLQSIIDMSIKEVSSG